MKMINRIIQWLSRHMIVVYAFFLVVSIGIGIWLGYHQNIQEEYLTHTQSQTQKPVNLTDRAEFELNHLGEETFLVTGLNKIAMTTDYILSQDIDYQLQGDRYHASLNKVKVFKKESPKQVYKEYDLIKLSQHYSKSAIPNKLHVNLYVNQLDQQLYFAFSYLDVESNDHDEARAVYVNIETGKTYTHSNLFTESLVVSWRKLYFTRKLADYGLVLATSSNGYVALEADFKKEPKLEKLKISKNYPQLEQELREGKSFVITGDQAYSEMVKLLAKEGEEDLYTNLHLSEHETKDGQEHVLKSYQDFLEWYK